MTGRLRVLFVPAWYPSEANPANGLFMRDLARAISARHDVVVLAPNDVVPSTAEDELLTVWATMPEAAGLTGDLARLAAIRRALRRLRAEGRPADLIHAHVFVRGMLAAIARAGRGSRVPLVITENFSGHLSGRVTGLRAQYARFAYRQADTVCPVSDLMHRRLSKLQPHAHYRVVPEVVDVDAFAGERRPRVEGEPLRIVTVCHLTRRKGLHDLIEAVRLLSGRSTPVRLTIVGDGPERGALEAQAAGLPVVFRGMLERDGVAAEIRAADVFALPTLADPFAIAPVEALAAGIPVVVTDAAGAAGLIAANGGAIVPPSDASALARAIESLGEHDDVPADVAERIRMSCGPESVAAQYDEIYRSVVTNRPTR